YSLGTALAVIGNTLIAVSLNVQKYAHRKRETQEEEEESSLCGPNSYLRSYTWWVGIVLMAVGEVGNFVAYGFAPASVVAPLGDLIVDCSFHDCIMCENKNDIITFFKRLIFIKYILPPTCLYVCIAVDRFCMLILVLKTTDCDCGFQNTSCVAVLVNGGLAMVFNNESLRMRDVVGASFAIVGSFLVVTFSSKPKLILNAQELIAHLGGWQFIIYMFLEIVMFGIIIFIKSQDVKNVFIHLSLVAILGSFTVISAKAVSGLLALTLEGKSQLGEPILYIMVVIMIGTTLFQVKYLNAAMRLYDIATVVPINFVLFTISAILAGTLFYQELSREPGINILMFIFGCLLSFMGVIFIAGDKGE
uniref:NIPA like domain containing 2 n=1 Tax=Ciona savignyi TaxID=51511 RepID=H2YYE5_CIOSA